MLFILDVIKQERIMFLNCSQQYNSLSVLKGSNNEKKKEMWVQIVASHSSLLLELSNGKICVQISAGVSFLFAFSCAVFADQLQGKQKDSHSRLCALCLWTCSLPRYTARCWHCLSEMRLLPQQKIAQETSSSPFLFVCFAVFCLCVCVCACVRACVRVCVRACVRAWDFCDNIRNMYGFETNMFYCVPIDRPGRQMIRCPPHEWEVRWPLPTFPDGVIPVT